MKQKPKEKFYVAYGSNLNIRQMQMRCPTAKLYAVGEIRDYELQFKGMPDRAFATIAPQEGSSVPAEKCVSDDEIRRLLFTFRQDFPEQTAAVLIAGCVKLDAVLYQKDGRIHLGCDLYVKDSPDSAEWIFYEALCDTEDVSELSMLKILDHAAKEYGLSYTECCFERLHGVTISTEPK